MSIATLLQRPARILIGAALFASAMTGAAFWWGHAPGKTADLVAALNAFSGEWKGEATIESATGNILATVPVTRRYSWVGGRQIVETQFHTGAEAYTTHAMQWIEQGRLHAVVTGPEDVPINFTGAPTSDGILWSNVDRPDSDCLDRIVQRDGRDTMQTASFTNVRFANISGLVGVAAILERRAPGEGSPESEKLQKVATRVDAIERTLAGVVSEREEFRAMIARAEQARAAAEARATVVAEKEASRANRLQINSAPAGLAFSIHATGANGEAPTKPVLEGTTPVTLEALPEGDYTVTVHGAGTPDVVHYVTLQEHDSVVLFHRQIAQAVAQATTSPRAPNTAPVAAPAAAPAPTPASVTTPAKAMASDVALISELDQAPKPTRTVLPRLAGFPDYSGKRLNVSVLIDEKGVPREAVALDVDDQRVARLCCAAVAKWRFSPALKAGRPVKVRVTVPFEVR